MKFVKFRIVEDEYSGYECQIWRWYWPFWIQMGFTNTHRSIEKARKYIERYKRRSVAVEYID